ncbi:MAG: hypothetical protein KKG95_08160 [Candidatus Omnitrophica bacterium]|nr:hypothetical protein [Candidatus Omnitrophota bacterium]
MSFTRAKPLGWVQGEKVTPTEINHIDVNQSRALDGTNGGLYTPASTLNILGGLPGGMGIEYLTAGSIRMTDGPVDMDTLSPSHGIRYRLLQQPLVADIEIDCRIDMLLINGWVGGVHFVDLSLTSTVPQNGELIRVAVAEGIGPYHIIVRSGLAGVPIFDHNTPGLPALNPPTWADFIYDAVGAIWVMVGGHVYIP